MDKTFIRYHKFVNGGLHSDDMEVMWREFADKLMEGKEIEDFEKKFFACCLLDACDAYKERNGSTAYVHSEITWSLGLRRDSGRQMSDEYQEADIYQAIINRMQEGEINKRTGQSKPIGYKKAISKLYEEKNEVFKAAQNTTPENIQRIYKKIDKMRKAFEAECAEP